MNHSVLGILLAQFWFFLNWNGKVTPKLIINDLVKSREFNYRWLSKKIHIQGVVFFQERGYTCSMPSV